MITCKNCHHSFEGKYCSNCSQPADTERLNFKSVWHDLRGSLLRFNDQLPFTTKELFLRPGYSIKEYIAGKRIKHFKPFSYLLLIAGIYALLNNYFHTQIIEDSDSALNLQRVGIKDFNAWFMANYALINLAMVPLYALFSYLLLRKAGYNFVEHAVINCYLSAQKLLFSILFFPITYFTYSTPYIQYVRHGSAVLSVVLMYWTYSQIFTKQNKWKLAGIILLIHVLVLVLITGVVAGIMYA